MASVKILEARKSYGAAPVLHGVSVDIADGEFVILVGPSGCGKSTLLRMIAGLETITGGEIRIGSRVVNNVPPKERDIAMVFQNYALYPHMTVAENMAFSLKLKRAPKSEIQQKVNRAAEILGLSKLLDRYPRQLSGGQRQRVAMGRAIVRDPQVFLFDEPLSNLDAKLRVAMRSEIKALHQRLATTTVYVTHDQVEAMTMADRIVVMQDGRVEQVGAPLELYDRPTNLFVATFIGSPAMNLTEGRLIRDDGGLAVVFSGHKVPVPDQAIAEHPGLERFRDRQVIIGVRPSSLEDAAFAPRRWPQIKAEAGVTEKLGSEVDVIFPIKSPPVQHEVMVAQFDKAAKDSPPAGGEPGQPSALVGASESLWTARVNPKTSARPGSAIDLAVDTSALYWFDPDSGQAIARQAAGDRPGSLQDATPPAAVA